MLILVSGGTEAIDKLRTNPEYAHLAHLHIGGLVTPRTGNDINWYLARGMSWAMDNDCFQGLDREAFIRCLKIHAGVPDCLWVNAPDVVANAQATLVRFGMWEPVLRYFDYPVAFTAQDGLEDLEIPWGNFECLFIGGSTKWKLGPAAGRIVQEAKAKGKLVHMGRVNSMVRVRYAKALGCDSVDGTGFSQFGNEKLPWGIALASRQYIPVQFKKGKTA